MLILGKDLQEGIWRQKFEKPLGYIVAAFRRHRRERFSSPIADPEEPAPGSR